MGDYSTLTFAIAVELADTDEGPQIRFKQFNDGIPAHFCVAMVDAWLFYNKRNFRNDFKTRYL